MTQGAIRRQAPGPRGLPWIGQARSVRRDVLGLLTSAARDHGDVVRFTIGGRIVHLVNHPDPIDHVLASNRANYDKQSRSTAALSRICGESLLTADGDAWRWRRRLIQPAFHHAAVAGFQTTMVDCTRATIEQWTASARSGQPVEAASDLASLTYRIVSRCLFGADAGRESGEIGAAMEILVGTTYRRWRSLLPANWPVPAQRRFRAALARVDTIVARLIADRTAAGTDRPDLLGLLLAGTDPETGRHLDAGQVRNEAITFLLAGHETTAMALAWTLHLLSLHPGDADALAAADPANAAAADPFFREALRLYPPIWAIERRAIGDDLIAGFHIPAGSSVIVSPYALHRHPAFWQEPERFDTGRFMEADDPPAYLPFGAGPRSCVGQTFAFAEARTILPAVVRAFRFDPDHRVEPEPAITLRMRHGLRLKLRMR